MKLSKVNLNFAVKSTFKIKNVTIEDSDTCWPAVPSLSRLNVYRLYVVAFNSTIGILVFYNIQKTKLLQLLTTLMRWLAFIAMISLAFRKVLDNERKHTPAEVQYVNVAGVPNFFGVCIYAFMCHHSLPSIITPMRNKESYKTVFTLVYSCIMVFYLLLSYTGVFAFGKNLNDFYTLNFLPNSDSDQDQNIFLTIIDYYLSLFPVFTISASFPIIGITLRNNLRSLYYFVSKTDETSVSKNYFVSVGLPLITLLPPMGIALITHDLQLLVGVTGSYAGVAIQYVIPSCLVYFGRREAIRVFRRNFQPVHAYASPFMHKYWVYFVLLWSNVSVIFVTVNHILTRK
jgi:amino acid permease